MWFINLLFGIVYFKIADEATDIAGVQSLVASICMVAAFASMMNLNLTLPFIMSSRSVLYRETSAWYYTDLVNTLAAAIVEGAWLLGVTYASVPIAYFMSGLSTNAEVCLTHIFMIYILTLVFAM